MLAEFAREELAAGLDAVALEVLAEAGIDRPPVDAFRVARALGITVAVDDRQHGRARYVRLRSRGTAGPKATILLRSDPRHERQQWALAHEIGEHVAHRMFARLGVDPRETVPDAREVVATHLAGWLLAPGTWLMADAAACGWDLLQLKARYTTASHELLARRMLQCPPPVIITIFDHAQVTFRRSNLPGHVPPPSPAEIACWRQAHETNRPAQTDDCLLTIQACPVHEDDWKREILRTEIEEFPTDD